MHQISEEMKRASLFPIFLNNLLHPILKMNAQKHI